MGKISRLNKYVNLLDRDSGGHSGLDRALERTAVGLGIRFAQLVSRVKHDFRFGDAEKKMTAATTLIVFCAGFPLIAAYQAAMTIGEAADFHQDIIERNTPPD